ncbi:MAG: threonine-phosphate decarboxylase CobD [Candidatus Omnitrophota bacterium]|nr:threonine-phosphate decarboxylase CobD [Candidatus Omnitrophota bacterium]
MLVTNARQRVHGGDPWRLMRETGAPRAQILDFSVDVNPLGSPASVRSLILGQMEAIQDYPDPEAVALREALSAAHHLSPEMILPGNGSAELIGLLGRSQPMTRALVVAPTFTEYEWALQHAGVVVQRAFTEEARGFRLEWDTGTWRQALEGVGLVVLCNPNNPTGVALPKADVLHLAQACEDAGVQLVIDEAFVELTDRPEEISVLPQVRELGHVVVLRSLTKCFAIPGLRVGYVVASPSVVERLRALQQPWPLNTFAIAVGAELFKETDYLARSRRLLRELRQSFQQALGRLSGLRSFATDVNFVLCKIERSDLTSSDLCRRLAEQGILIRNCDSFTGLESGRFIRMAIRLPEENARLLGALREVFVP